MFGIQAGALELIYGFSLYSNNCSMAWYVTRDRHTLENILFVNRSHQQEGIEFNFYTHLIVGT